MSKSNRSHHLLSQFLHESDVSILHLCGVTNVEQLLDADRFELAKKLSILSAPNADKPHSISHATLEKLAKITSRPAKSLEAQIYCWQLRVKRGIGEQLEGNSVVTDTAVKVDPKELQSEVIDASSKKKYTSKRKPGLDFLKSRIRPVQEELGVVLSVNMIYDDEKHGGCWFIDFLKRSYFSSLPGINWTIILTEIHNESRKRQMCDRAIEYLSESNSQTQQQRFNDVVKLLISQSNEVSANIRKDAIQQYIYCLKEIGEIALHETSCREHNTILEHSKLVGKRPISDCLNYLQSSFLQPEDKTELYHILRKLIFGISYQIYNGTIQNDRTSDNNAPNLMKRKSKKDLVFPIDNRSLSLISNWAPTTLEALEKVGSLECDVFPIYKIRIVEEINHFVSSRSTQEVVSKESYPIFSCITEKPDWQTNDLTRNMFPEDKEIATFLNSQWIFSQTQLKALQCLKAISYEFQKYCYFNHSLPCSFFSCYKFIQDVKNMNLLPTGKAIDMEISPLANYFLQRGEKHILTFFEEQNLKTFTEFFKLRFGEKSDFILDYLEFRSKYCLSEVTSLMASRFFNMISQRFSLVINSVPVSPCTRRYFSGCLVILGETSCRFLETMGITTDVEFLEYKTVKLGKEYEFYRSDNSLSELKGKGAIASISQWKCNVRDVMECYHLDQFKNSSDELSLTSTAGQGSTCNVAIPNKAKEFRMEMLINKTNTSQVVMSKNKSGSTKTKLDSSNQEISNVSLGREWNVERGSCVDTNNNKAMKLKTNNEEIFFKTIESRKMANPAMMLEKLLVPVVPMQNLPSSNLPPLPYSALMSSFTMQPNIVQTLPKQAKKRKQNEDRLDNKKEGNEKQRKKRKRKVNMHDDNKNSKTVHPSNKKSLSTIESNTRRLEVEESLDEKNIDPLQILSKTSRKFLQYLNIETTSSFLSKKTGWLAVKFIEWRHKNSLSAMKKHSAVTTVSGWKSDVRKIAKPEDIPTPDSWKERDENKKPSKHSFKDDVARDAIKLTITHISKLKGTQTFQIIVAGEYLFRLDNSECGKHLQYCGCKGNTFKTFNGKILIGSMKKGNPDSEFIPHHRALVSNYIDNGFRSLNIGDKILDISKTKMAKSLFGFTMIFQNNSIEISATKGHYNLLLNLEMKFGQIFTSNSSLRPIREIAAKWLILKNGLMTMSISEKEECINLIRLYFESYTDKVENLVIMYRLWTLSEAIEVNSTIGCEILTKVIDLSKLLIKFNSNDGVAILLRFKNEASGILLSKMMQTVSFDSLDTVSKDFVEEMILLIVSFQWQLGRAKLADDLLNDLLNCSLSYFHIAPNRAELLKLANKIITIGVVEFEDYTVDVLLDFCSHMHDPDVLDEMYDIVDSTSFQSCTLEDIAVMSNSHASIEFNVLPDTKVVFDRVIHQVILKNGWKFSNRCYFSPEFLGIDEEYLPQSLIMYLVHTYDKVCNGLLPCIPAHYNIHYCLTQWVNACKISEPITSEAVFLNDVKAKKLADQLLTFFDSLFMSHLLLDEEKDQFSNLFFYKNGDKRPCQLYGVEYFLRLLILLPDILRSSKISKEKQNTVLSMVRPLSLFLVDNMDTIFSNDYKLGDNRSIHDEEKSANIETILEEDDCKLLTEYTHDVLSQVLICHASKDDIVGKRRSIKVGWPGLQCKWCSGNDMSITNTFYSANVESMAAVPSVIFAHLQRCVMVPDDIKNNLTKLKKDHNYARKRLPHGSQAIFYRKLWDRIHSSAKETSAKDIKLRSKGFNSKQIAASGRKGKRRKLLYSDQTQTSSKGLESYTKVIDYLIEKQNLSSSSPDSNSVSEALWKYFEYCKLIGERFSINKASINDPLRIIQELEERRSDEEHKFRRDRISDLIDFTHFDSILVKDMEDDIGFYAGEIISCENQKN